MDLPDPEHLRALLTVARECGVTRLSIGTFEAELSPLPAGVEVVRAINRGAPLAEDPLDVVRREAGSASRLPVRDLLDVLANGGRLVEIIAADPTQAA